MKQPITRKSLGTDVVDPIDMTPNKQTAQNFLSLLLSFEGNWHVWGREDTNKVEWFGKFPSKKINRWNLCEIYYEFVLKTLLQWFLF